MALIFTALLGIAGYVVQSKNAAAADRAQHEIVQEAADREQARGLAAIQLERVRGQMGDVYRPVQVMLIQADNCVIYLQRELGFEYNDVHDIEYVRPFVLWPHVEVYSRAWSSKWFAAYKGSPYKKYSPADLALLEDPAKRQLYIEAHAGCIAPRWRDVAAILATKSALMEPPPASYLDGAYSADAVDWTKFSGGSLSVHMSDMAAFAHAWAPLERRWEVGGTPHCMRSCALFRMSACSVVYFWIMCGWLIYRFGRLLPNAAQPAEPVAHRVHSFPEDDQRGRGEGGRAPGLFERDARERGARAPRGSDGRDVSG
jgi:hypothetical protein